MKRKNCIAIRVDKVKYLKNKWKPIILQLTVQIYLHGNVSPSIKKEVATEFIITKEMEASNSKKHVPQGFTQYK